MTAARHIPRIDPARRPPADPIARVDLSGPGNPAHAEWAARGLDAPDMDIVRDWRLARIREQLRWRDLTAAVLFDPLNVRYATDSTNMQVWCTHNQVRYAFVATEGPLVLFDFHGCGHLSEHLPLVTERRPALAWHYFEAGDRAAELAARWAGEIADLVREHGGGNRRLAVDKVDLEGARALAAAGLEVVPGQAFTEEARKIKHLEELKAMRRAIDTTEVAMAAMWRALEPGMTENRLWSILHQVNIERGGEWIETRLLASGPRTNPWFHESSDRVIEDGDMLAFDTDLIGPYGYCADISRGWVTGGRPNADQRMLHAVACEALAHNMDLVRAGTGFRELSEKAFRLPEACLPNRYSTVVHGVGLCDEYPAVRHLEDWEAAGYEGVFEPGMCICFEAYVGPVGGREGIKLEHQAVVTETGVERLDTFPDALVPEF